MLGGFDDCIAFFKVSRYNHCKVLSLEKSLFFFSSFNPLHHLWQGNRAQKTSKLTNFPEMDESCKKLHSIWDSVRKVSELKWIMGEENFIFCMREYTFFKVHLVAIENTNIGTRKIYMEMSWILQSIGCPG